MIPIGFAIRILGPVAIVAAVWLHGCSVGEAKAERKHQAAVAEAQEAAAETLKLRLQANAKVTDEHHAKTLRATAAAATARADRDRLQELLASQDRGSTAEPPVDVGAATARGFRECIGEYQALAEAADRLSTQVTGLQSYVAGVCLGEK